jgi:hypothetical protein
MIEMVRKAGDASAKVPYLMNEGETAKTILDTLREVAQPQVAYLKKLPEPVQATIHTLLSINMVPTGYEAYGIPALLEINRMQQALTKTLKEQMSGRQMAEDFHRDNKKALEMLDADWQHVRKSDSPWPFVQSLPEHPQMQYIPVFHKKMLVALREVCVIVDPPNAQLLRALTPSILKNPLPELEFAPVTGSADWLLRVVGKIGRHFTRALLDIIMKHLQEEKVALDAKNALMVNLRAQEALREFVERNP